MHVEQVNAWYHEGGCLSRAQEAYAEGGDPTPHVVTGRMPLTAGSNGPRYQNVPVRTPEGRRIREAFREAAHIVAPIVAQIQASEGRGPDPVVEVDADGQPTRVTVTAGSAETVTPTIRPLRPPTNLKRGSLAMAGAEYEPGNGTRYQLMLLWAPRDRTVTPLLVWTNGPGGGRSMFVPHSGLAVSYIAEKLGCNVADAEAIALFLRHAT